MLFTGATALLAAERADHQQPRLQPVGSDLQGPDDHGCRGRPTRPPRGHRRDDRPQRAWPGSSGAVCGRGSRQPRAGRRLPRTTTTNPMGRCSCRQRGEVVDVRHLRSLVSSDPGSGRPPASRRRAIETPQSARRRGPAALRCRPAVEHPTSSGRAPRTDPLRVIRSASSPPRRAPRTDPRRSRPQRAGRIRSQLPSHPDAEPSTSREPSPRSSTVAGCASRSATASQRPFWKRSTAMYSS